MRKNLPLRLLACLLFVAGCSSSPDDTKPASPNAEAGNARSVGSGSPDLADFDPTSDSPPLMTVRRGDSELTLMAYTYCWTAEGAEAGICADGAPPAEPEVLGGSGPIEVYFPIDDFMFESRFWDESFTTERSGPTLSAVDTHWELDAPDELPAVVEVFGFNDSNDVIVAFMVAE